jgi:uncharacterized protein (DUF1800 family)
MTRLTLQLWLCLIASLASTAAAFAQTSENIFRDGFEIGTAPTDAEASRFLTQATFGPSASAVAELRQLGYAGWIDQQRALPITLHRPDVEAQIAASAAANPQPAGAYRRLRIEKWWNTAILAPDQLRQRVAFALSQIFVISDATGGLNNTVTAVAEYQDILLRNALGNYRTLLEEVTRSPMMGIYLSSLRNPKTEWTLVNGVLTPGTIQPDENYAREVMQLFSVGLIERNLNFTPLLSGGQTIPTYTQDTITQTARVLTGLNYRCTQGSVSFGSITLTRNCNCTGTQCNFQNNLFASRPPTYIASVGGINIGTGLAHPDAYAPMACYPRFADTGRSSTADNSYAVLPAPFNTKTLIAGVTVQASPVACYTATPAADQQACINYCDDQIDRLLDALHLHPNTPPMVARQLIQRLVSANPSGAYIQRVAQVFVNNGSGVRGDMGAVVRAILLDSEARNAPSANAGKLREPLLRLTALMRAFGAPGSANQFQMFNPEGALLQRPLGAPSVFNFYEPDYQPPGELTTANLFSPELQITSESTVVSASDYMYNRVVAGYGMNVAGTPFTQPSGAHLPPAVIDALPSDATALVDALNLRLMYGSMSSTMRSKLIALLTGPMAAAEARRKALLTIHLILISPEFAAQR